MTFTVSKVLLLISVVLFVLVGFRVEPAALSEIDLLGFGLAFLAASFLVP
jgi:hypothetical protein